MELILNYYQKILFISLNFIIYVIIHLPLDIYSLMTTADRANNELNTTKVPPAWSNTTIMVLTAGTSLYLWGIFIFAFFELQLRLSLFELLPILSSREFIPLINIGQIVSMLLLLYGTCIAILGRIHRRKEIMSWGIPSHLITHGIFNYIRHPLYGSYIAYFLGIPLLFNSFIVVPLLFGVYGYYKTSIYEESILEQHFDRYREYKKQTGRFFPKII